MGTLLNRRRYMGGNGEKPLPPGAVKIEYLESSGTQWIDTQVTPDSETTWITDGQYTSARNGVEFGIYSSIPYRLHWGLSSGKFYFGTGKNSVLRPDKVGDTNRHLISIFPDGTCSIDSESWKSGELIDMPASFSVYLFARHNVSTDTAGGLCSFRLYSSYIRTKKTTIDLIPIRIEQEGYLFDKISGTLFRNSGTGNFVLGPDKT